MLVQLSNTDFRDRNSVATLLFELQYIFSEFKKHEEIEDMYIVDELRSRMVKVLEGSDNDRVVATQRKPEIALEKDLHGDERLSAVIHVISNVQDVTRRHTCNRVIRLRQGQRLCEVLDEFTVDFVPHMREEEQVRINSVCARVRACLEPAGDPLSLSLSHSLLPLLGQRDRLAGSWSQGVGACMRACAYTLFRNVRSILSLLTCQPTHLELAWAICSLPNNKVPGESRILPEMVKEGGNIFRELLLDLIHQIWSSGDVPQAWEMPN